MSPRFTPQARDQFLGVLAYIAAQDEIAAAALLLRVERALQRLTRFPYSGRRIPEFPRESTREVVIRPYRLFYEIASDGVWISAVWHSAQRPAPPPSGGAQLET